MVDVFSVAALPLPDFLEPPSGVLGLLAFESAAMFLKIPAAGFDAGVGVSVAVAVIGEIGNAQIHAESARNLDRFRFFDFDGLEEVENVLLQDEIGFSLETREFFARFVDCVDRDALLQGSDAETVFAIGENPAVLDDRSVFSKAALHQLALLVCRLDALGRIGVADFTDHSCRQLGRNPEVRPDDRVNFVVQVKSAENPRLEGEPAGEVAGTVEGAHRGA